MENITVETPITSILVSRRNSQMMSDRKEKRGSNVKKIQSKTVTHSPDLYDALGQDSSSLA
jgi:hypothetical protein